MPLEATLLLADNSDFSINSDYLPSRWQAGTDALNMIFNAKCNANAESEVGLMTTAAEPDGSRRPQVLLTPTNDSIKLIAALHGVRQSGEIDLATSIQVAQLALKHRKNKNQRQRIIALVGSPLPTSEAHTKESLSKLGKKLKKNNVALDVVSYGETHDNAEQLQALVESTNSSDNSRLLVVPPSSLTLLSDQIRSSAILAEEGQGFGESSAGPSGAGGAAGDEDGFGVDPNLDPELAMALRMSIEDERARTAAAAGQSSSEPSAAAPPAQPSSSSMDVDESGAGRSAPASSSAAQPTPPAAAAATSQAESAGAAPQQNPAAAEDDPDLALAMAMSRGEDVEMSGGDNEPEQQQQQQGGQSPSSDEEDEDEIKRAIALSLQGGGDDKDKK